MSHAITDWEASMSGIDLVKLTRRRYLELLAELERAAGPPRTPLGVTNRRGQQRIPFHHSVLMACSLESNDDDGNDHEGGLASSRAVRCRNLSSRGVCLFMGERVRVDQPCRIMFINGDRETFIAPATVARCRELRCGVFEVGVRFNRAIDLRDLLPWLAGGTETKSGEDGRRVAV